LLVEGNETYFVNLTNATNATISDNQGLGTITDDDITSLAINDVTVTEGNSGTTNATFTVTLSAPSAQVVTVNFATANNTAVAPGDYTATSGTLTFAAGETTKTITVPVIGDLLVESNESYFVNLTNATNATIADAQGIGTITNDDAAVLSLTINDITTPEGNSGTANAIFTITLSAASTQNVTVNFATANGTATAPGDFTAVSGTVTFSPGQTTRTLAVPIVGDLLDEANETFFVNLSNATGATIADNQGVGTITDNDATHIASDQ
jgi:large repetitive protein